MKPEFFKLYHQVFDENGEIKACGRDTCFALIVVADEVEPGISHGDTHHNRVYPERMHSLYKKLMKKGKDNA